LIEAYTYRLGAHTTSDDPTKYREDDEVLVWQARDPIKRTKEYLIAQGLWSAEQDEAQVAEYEAYALEVFRKVEETGEPQLEDFFKYTYRDMPEHLKEQYQEYVQYLEGKVK